MENLKLLATALSSQYTLFDYYIANAYFARRDFYHYKLLAEPMCL